MKRLILSLTLIILGAATLFSQTSTPPVLGDGSVDNPYQIETLDNLNWLSQQGGVVNATSTYWEKHYIQTADINASATVSWYPDGSGGYSGFRPIGEFHESFTGSYDGQGHTIEGLTINRPGQDWIGLFGLVSGATIKNIGVTNVNILGKDGVGGLIGDIGGSSGDYSYVNNCFSSGIITGNIAVGGLIGEIGSTDVSNCYSSVTATGTYSTGGLIGWSSSSDIHNCYSRGNVIRSSGIITDFGAFCGNNDGPIEYCYSTGSVIYTGATNPSDKGFVGIDQAGSYVSNFWSSQISNQSTATGATNITESQMKDHTTFTDAGWDFEVETTNGTSDYWDIDYTPAAPPKIRVLAKAMAINNNYPYLSWQDGPDVSLPVELSSFIVEATNQGVLCQWTTESEIENLGFIIERKTEGVSWVEIASYKSDNNLFGHGTISTPTDYEYLDKLVEPNISYDYRLADVDYDGVVTYHATRNVTVEQALISSKIDAFTVLPAYPNPFNPNTTITYGLDTDSHVTIELYDITGQLISTLLNGEQTPGWHSVVWNGTNQRGEQTPAGIYLNRITSGNEVKTTKLMLLK